MTDLRELRNKITATIAIIDNVQKPTTQQVKTPPNPTGKGGFAEHPENRNPGGWKKEMVFSYQYRRFMNMSVQQMKAYSGTPESERTVVEDLAYSRVIAAKKSLSDVKEITDRTEGKAPQSIDMTTGGERINSYAALTTEELRQLAQR